MAIQSHVCLALFSLFLPLLLSQAIRDITTSSLIQTTCNKTPFPQLCKSALESDPRSATAANLSDLCKIAVDAVVVKVKETLAVASVAVNNQPDYESWARASACMWDMKVSVQTMTEKGVPAVGGGNFHAAYDAVRSVKSDATDCNEKFPEMSQNSTVLIELADDTMTMLQSLF